MSTKIYDGMIFESDNLSKFHKVIKQLHSEASIIKDELALKLIAYKYQTYFDNKTRKEEIANDFKRKLDEKTVNFILNNNYVFINILTELINKRCKSVLNSIERDISYDLDLVVNFAPVNKRILIYPYYEQKEYGILLNKYFKQFGYWNNTDKPDNVLGRDWTIRKKMWDKVVDEKMLKYTLINSNDIIISYPYSFDNFNDFSTKLISYFSPLPERASEYAKKKYIEEFIKNNQDSETTGFESVFSAIDSLKEEKVKVTIKRYTEEILATLQEIDVDILNHYRLEK
jgi:uncharacterized protein YjgD (DUF1641 family)